MKRVSKALKNEEKMKELTENKEEPHGENDVVAHCPFFLSIFNLLLQFSMAILRFLGFRVYRRSPLSSEDSYTNRSYLPPRMVDSPVVDESGQEESEFAEANPPPPPPPSNGGGGQTN